MKRLLIVYPNNFLQGAHGTNSYVGQLVNIFNEIGYKVDYFGFENFTPISTFKDFDELNKVKLIENLYIYDFQKGYHNGKNGKPSKLRVLKERVKRKLKRKINVNYLQDWVPDGAHRLFHDILDKNQYNVIIVFYTYLANLLKEKDIKAKKVYFMIDSMFLQQYSWDEDGNKKANITLGKLMDEEIERINYFDQIYCISNDERMFYEKITGRKMNFFPHLMPANNEKVKKPIHERKWDIFFIGFDNPFNVEGLNWFFDKVYPYLDPALKIVLVGSASKKLNIKYSNVDIIHFAPDLDEIFENVKVSICPMQRGTGMKTKVIESIAKGIPVVCNERGVDGIPDKTLCGCLVTEDPKQFAEYINDLINDESYYCEVIKRVNEYYGNIFDRNRYIEMLNNNFQRID